MKATGSCQEARVAEQVAEQNKGSGTCRRQIAAKLPLSATHLVPLLMEPGYRPPLFINITPVNPNGVTVIDLGQMDEGLETTRHSSLPPPESPSQETHENKLRGRRHCSLPPKLTKTRLSTPAEGLDEVSEGESDVTARSVSRRGETYNPARVS